MWLAILIFLEIIIYATLSLSHALCFIAGFSLCSVFVIFSNSLRYEDCEKK